MRTLSTVRVVVSVLLLSTWGLLGACTAEDENPAPNRPRTDSGASSSGVTPATSDGGVISLAICNKYGGGTAVKGIADGIVSTARLDCRISPEMNLGGEEAQHSLVCWEAFIGNVFQCPGVVFTLGVTESAPKKICQSYLPNITFTDLDYKAFIEDVRLALEAAKVSADDIKSLAPAFEQIKLNLVKKNPPNKYGECAPNCAKGGEACIPLPIDGGKEGGGDANPPPDSGQPSDAASEGG